MATKYTVQQAISRGYQIIANHPQYDQARRGSAIDSPYHDCSSFIGTCWDVPGRPATPNMVSVYTANGFTHKSFSSMAALERGDVLVYNGSQGGYGDDGHTAMYIGNGMLMEMSGSGAGVRAFYNMGWQDVLRGTGGVYISKWECTSHPSESFG